MINDLCFEIIQTCTNNCIFCSSMANHDCTHKVSLFDFKKTIQHFHDNGGIKEISISGGEPFLHEDLYEMVSFCTSLNITTNVYTSGVVDNYLKNSHDPELFQSIKKQKFMWIDKNMFLKLKACGVNKVVFDIQSEDNDEYNELMGNSAGFSCALSSLWNCQSVGIFTEIHFIPNKINVNKFEELLELCDLGNIKRISLLKFVPQGRGRDNKEKLQLSLDELKVFCNNVETIRNKYKVEIRMGIPLTDDDRHLCTAGLSKLSIRYDGVILPCVAFKELDQDTLNNLIRNNNIDFNIINIKDDLNKLNVKEGFHINPLCKQVYKEKEN